MYIYITKICVIIIIYYVIRFGKLKASVERLGLLQARNDMVAEERRLLLGQLGG